MIYCIAKAFGIPNSLTGRLSSVSILREGFTFRLLSQLSADHPDLEHLLPCQRNTAPGLLTLRVALLSRPNPIVSPARPRSFSPTQPCSFSSDRATSLDQDGATDTIPNTEFYCRW